MTKPKSPKTFMIVLRLHCYLQNMMSLNFVNVYFLMNISSSLLFATHIQGYFQVTLKSSLVMMRKKQKFGEMSWVFNQKNKHRHSPNSLSYYINRIVMI